MIQSFVILSALLRATLFPYTTLFRSFRELNEQRRPSYLKAALRIETSGKDIEMVAAEAARCLGFEEKNAACGFRRDRKSTRLNSSHVRISYAVFCLKKKKKNMTRLKK